MNNAILIKSSQSQGIREHVYKTLGTSIIYNLPPPIPGKNYVIKTIVELIIIIKLDTRSKVIWL